MAPSSTYGIQRTRGFQKKSRKRYYFTVWILVSALAIAWFAWEYQSSTPIAQAPNFETQIAQTPSENTAEANIAETNSTETTSETPATNTTTQSSQNTPAFKVTNDNTEQAPIIINTPTQTTEQDSTQAASASSTDDSVTKSADTAETTATRETTQSSDAKPTEAQPATETTQENSPTQPAEATQETTQETTQESEPANTEASIADKLEADIGNSAAPANFHILQAISFTRNATELTTDSAPQIKSLAEILQRHPEAKVLIRGHTDNIGKRYVNRSVSLHRALSVKNALVALGIHKKRIKVQAMGEDEPLLKNTSKENRQANRRIDISVLR